MPQMWGVVASIRRRKPANKGISRASRSRPRLAEDPGYKNGDDIKHEHGGRKQHHVWDVAGWGKHGGSNQDHYCGGFPDANQKFGINDPDSSEHVGLSLIHI